MSSGGARPGAGRPRGSNYDQIRLGLRAAVRKRLVEIIEAGDDPLEFLVGVVKDASVDLETRMRVAMFLTPYVHPRQYGCPPQLDISARRVTKTMDIPT